ncbi:MAG: PIG-L family deacetylase [Nannocystaceae bacterium]
MNCGTRPLLAAALLLGCAGDAGDASTDASATTGSATTDASAGTEATTTDATGATETAGTSGTEGATEGSSETETETTGTPASETVVWIGAHPDDELYAAPWLADRCLERAASCKLVVLTFGESGTCKDPDGCAPDLVTVRKAELAGSAAIFGAAVTHLDLGDGTAGSPAGVLANWSAVAGSTDALVEQIAGELAQADRLVTFDPRHGESCHADHRAAGAVAVAAAELAGLAPDHVHLVASRLIVEPAVAEDPAVYAFDASVVLTATAAPAWATLVDVLTNYASQFTADEVAMIDAVPPAQQRTWLVDLDQVTADDPLYAGLCP